MDIPPGLLSGAVFAIKVNGETSYRKGGDVSNHASSLFRCVHIMDSRRTVGDGTVSKFASWLVVAAALSIAASAAGGADGGYPARPIRLVVPSPAGGGMDTLARTIGQHLTEQWRQQVVVDARPGATGIIGTDIVAKSTPDGYTLLLAWIAPLAINPALYKKLPYDVSKDLAPVMLVATTPHVLVVATSLGVTSVKDFTALAKAKPGQLSYASSGIGGSSHLAGELFKSLTGVDIVHVPYKGTPPALVDLMAGRIQLMFAAAAPAMPHVKSGKLKAVAVTTPKRSHNLPELPAIAETVPGFDAETWYGMMAPAGTPVAIVLRLNAEITRFLKQAEVSQKLSMQGFDVAVSSPQELATFLRSELKKWRSVIQNADIRAE